MSYHVIISNELKKTLTFLKKRDNTMFRALEKKMMKIATSDLLFIQHFKNLRSPLNDLRRVHLGSYVLLFRIKGDTIIFEAFEHHDLIYKKKP